MGSSRAVRTDKSHLPFKTGNKTKRHELHVKQKKARDSLKRDERFRRRREEEKNPQLKEERLARNVPITIDQKRTWDQVGGDEEDALGLAVDVDRIKRQKTEAQEQEAELEDEEDEDEVEEHNSDMDSMLDEDEDKDDSSDEDNAKGKRKQKEAGPTRRATSPTSTTGTNMDLTPEGLVAKFPTLFAAQEKDPKVLVTTSINSNLHYEAELVCSLFPNSNYIRRTAHFNAHKYSVREIAKFAANREYTTLVILMEDQKKPEGLDIVHLPSGPMFHFTISNWVEGRKLPGHGNPTNHYPELILNNFRTPLGLLTAHLFKTIFPPQPEVQGRQVVTLHNQRDYIFVRRHRYVFRDKRASEKSILDKDGKPMKGAEEIRAGLQELGPRFTLKLRRVDRNIQRASGQEWEWKSRMEKVRTRFQL
ncbi:Brix-domain-containing protein [Lophium mytilinum]|uniref:Brix-domain-containing protein n=1 Tax=Lophium mytilinum TaxID=390894 RepID=A0A6A6QW14_9PEZI|nr:Brix-domain-containing protein [Lophium mytilinum]